MEEELEPLPYKLTPGKPFDGTTINFLVCCPTAGQFVAWQNRVSEFTELTGITVEFANEPWGSFQERIVTESIAGTGSFDVVLWLDAWGPSFIQTLQPIQPWAERDGIDMGDFADVFLNAASYNNHVYGVPVRGHAFVYFYRKDIFEELGLEPATTWDEYVENGKVIQENTDLAGIANYYGVASAQSLFNWQLLLWGEDTDIFDENFKPIFNSDAGVKATETYMTFRDAGQEGQFAADEGAARVSMEQGQTAQMVGWWWFLNNFNNPETSEVVDQIGVAPVPGLPGKDPIGFGLTMPVGISAFSRNQDAAWEFIKWVTSPELEKAVVTDKSDPAGATVVAVHTSNHIDDEVNAANAGLHAAAAPSLENARNQPLIPEWAEVSSILEIAINEIALGAEVQATLDEAAADVETVMERAGYYSE